MVITYKNLHLVKFPVYLLWSDNWELADGLLFVDQKLVDDKNMPGATLGIRRMQTPHKALQPLKRAIFTQNGILKQSTKYFIDSHGFPFIYEKTKMCTLKYYKIMKVVQKDVASLIWVNGCKTPFTVPRPPEHGMRWAGILHLQGIPWMLYEYAEEQLKDTQRKV